MKVWKDSGRIGERGRGQYVMGRYGDKGAYEIGNVKIITAAENTREGKKLTGNNNPATRPEVRAKISASRRGKKASAATRAEMSANRRNKKLSPDHWANISAGLRGRTLSDETRANIRAKAIGRRPSPKTRAKMSLAHKARRRLFEQLIEAADRREAPR